MKLLKLAWKNIIHNPLNLLLSIILFGLGIGLINFLILFNTQLKNKFDSNLAGIDLVIGAKGSPLQMILSSMYHVDAPTGNVKVGEVKAFLNPKHPLIKAAVPLSLGDNYKSYRIVGTTDSLMSFYHATLQQGKFYDRDLEVVIGRAVADDTGLKLGDRFKSSHGFNDDDDLAHDHAAFKVVGILNGTGSVIDQLILTNPSTVWNVHDHSDEESPLTPNEDDHEGHDHDGDGHPDHAAEDHGDHDHDGDGQPDHTPEEHEGHDHSAHDQGALARTNAELLNYPDKEITTLLIKFRNRTNFQALSMPRNINDNTDMQAASPAIEINRLYAMIGSGRQMLQWLAALIGIISAVSIFIVLLKSMRERKYELALIRVMGGSRSSLYSLITIEGMIMTAIGFFVGFILSHIGMEILAGSLKSSYKYSFTGWHFMKEEWMLLGLSLFIGVIASLIPAISAARMDIHETLNDR
ncbi:MAG: putative ABC transport system permease protein [Saprospiraceae bacterium]|jgi:putative ABC transport system permease protein